MAPGGGGGQQPDNSLGPLWIMLFICIIGGLIWYFLHAYLMLVFLKLKVIEMEVIGLFTSRLDGVRAYASTVSPGAVTFVQAQYVASSVGKYIAIPCVVLMLLLAVVIYKAASATGYRRSYNMKELSQAQQEIWPQIKPVVPLNLIKEDIRKGVWAMSLTPMEFAKQKRLIIEEEIMPLEDELLRRKRVIAKLDKGRANALFTLQLGRLWRGFEALPPYLQALFGVFAAKANGDRDTAYAVLAALSRAYDSEKNTIVCENPLLLCRKYMNVKAVKLVMTSHAYELTVMSSMLELSRYDGVLSSSDFLWLKPIDRKAWFVLNGVGRRTPVCEAAGVFAHWLAEKELGKKSVLPMVESATLALESALTEIAYHRDEDAQYYNASTG
ncbi:MAG: type IVB secretion system coupling complex protein DotM/IcmP [Gammaproteobacteria bacterium]|nr:type IVB secretion system coupling complex protein DotM/IcmP [Gammaproteobacteria bacterium]